MMNENILIIDDEINIAQTLADLLELRGYTVRTAFNGLAGFTKALKEMPDLILCDVMMPKMDGYEVLEAIREHEELKKIPFIFLTAKGNQEDFRSGMDLGADDYMVKPVDAGHLFKIIEKRLKKHEHLLELGHSEENQRIVGELHDTLQQTLLGLKMNLAYILENTEEGHIRSKVEESVKVANLSLSQLRMIIEDSDIFAQEVDFNAAVNNLAKRVDAYVPFELRVSTSIHQEIDKKSSQSLFRVLFEILNNAIKHSSASLMEIGISSDNQRVVRLIAKDNGNGFDLNQIKGGHGLKGIKQRVAKIGGSVKIDSSVGQGTIIEVSINPGANEAGTDY